MFLDFRVRTAGLPGSGGLYERKVCDSPRFGGSRDIFIGPGAQPRGGEPAAVKVEVEDMDRRRQSAVARHQDVLAVAPSMPMKLIAPVAYGGAAVGGGCRLGREGRRRRHLAVHRRRHRRRGPRHRHRQEPPRLRRREDHREGLHRRRQRRPARPRHALRGHDLRPGCQRHADRRRARRQDGADREGSRQTGRLERKHRERDPVGRRRRRERHLDVAGYGLSGVPEATAAAADCRRSWPPRSPSKGTARTCCSSSGWRRWSSRSAASCKRR